MITDNGERDLRSYVLDSSKLGALMIYDRLASAEADVAKWSADHPEVSSLVQEGTDNANRLLGWMGVSPKVAQVTREDILAVARGLAAGDPDAYAVGKNTIDALTGRFPRSARPEASPARKRLTPVVRRRVEAREEIMQVSADKVDFLHTVLCQVGMPRSRVEGRSFARKNGSISLEIEAGDLWDGHKFCPQPLPYGTKPRLVMVHIASEAVRTRSREIEVGHSIRDFLRTLGLGASGGREGPMTGFQKQMHALAACRMTLGMVGIPGTMWTQPIERFRAWLHPTGEQRTLWPGTMTLTPTFFETLLEFAVPLDPRALRSLQNSALALDVYTWLAHRLCRIAQPEGVWLSWGNLQDQFGEEYADQRNFKRELRKSLKAARAVYPDARIDDEPGGIRLLASPPPVAKTRIQVLLPAG